jgi:hypothetical protein
MRRRTRGERFAAEAPRKAGRPLLTSASAGARVSAYPLGSPRFERFRGTPHRSQPARSCLSAVSANPLIFAVGKRSCEGARSFG